MSFQASPDGRPEVEDTSTQNVSTRLQAWREAERHRDGLAEGSPERAAADELVRTAQTAFHAEFAQASARYAEEEFWDAARGWSALLVDRRTSVSRD